MVGPFLPVAATGTRVHCVSIPIAILQYSEYLSVGRYLPVLFYHGLLQYCNSRYRYGPYGYCNMAIWAIFINKVQVSIAILGTLSISNGIYLLRGKQLVYGHSMLLYMYLQ